MNDKVVPVPVIVPVNVLACESCFFCPKGRVFLFYSCRCQRHRGMVDGFGWKLAYKQKHHAIPRIGE